jgi:hypothetical protein
MMPTAMPMAMAPAMMAVPMPVPMMMAPAYLFRLDAIDVCLRNDCGFSAFAIGRLRRGDGRQRRGLRTCRKRSCARHESKREFQKIPAFHESAPAFVKDESSVAAP